MAVEKNHPAHPEYKHAWPPAQELRSMFKAMGIRRGDRVILDKVAVAWSHCSFEDAELIDATYQGVGKDGEIVYRRNGGGTKAKNEREELIWPDTDVGYGPCGEGFRTFQNIWKHPATHSRV